MIGIRTTFQVAANVAFTSDIVPATIGLTSPILVGQNLSFQAFIPVTVGATGGIRAIVVVPAAVALFNVGIVLYNTVAPAIVTAHQAASAAFTNALANAGTHWLEIKGTVINGVNAGTLDIQVAQNTSDVLTATFLRGGYMNVTLNTP